MSSRRARVKLAPNLGISRNKAKPAPLKPKIVVKSDTDNSDTEHISDLELDVQQNNVDTVEESTKLDDVVKDKSKGVGFDTDVHIEDLSLLLTSSPLKSSVVVSLPSSSSSVTTSPPTTVFDIVTNPVKPVTTTSPMVANSAANGDDEASDWEDEQFTYKSVEVNENEEMYKSLEITPSDAPDDSFDINLKAAKPDSEKAFVLDTGHVVNPALAPAMAVITQANPVSPKVRLPMGKNKFKPNLNFDRRSRNISGGSSSCRPSVPTGSAPPSSTGLPVAVSRSRTISGSSTSSEPEMLPPRNSFSPSPSPSLLRAAVTAPMSPKPARVKKHGEGRSVGERSQFMRRKLDHKRKFMRGVPERGSMTMFDLIYYNPEHGQRMSVEEEDKEIDNPDDPANDNQQVPNGTGDNVAQEPVTPERAAVAEEEAVPVPQVKVGVNGEIILDESSLQLETTEQKKAKDLLQKSAVVWENNKTSTNYGTWSKKRRHSDWSEKETLRFYRALSVVGSDFSMMESIFKNRTRQELKLKFKKEEKLNNKMIDKCLRERGMYTDLAGLMEDSEEDEMEEEKGRGRKAKKKRPRRRYKNRGYYDSSSGGEDADVENSRSPARKRVRQGSREERQVVRIKRPQVMHRESVSDKARPIQPRTEAISLSQIAATAKQGGVVSVGGIRLSTGHHGHAGRPGVHFPPGLLAANPVLTAAQPGSLVVVASPNKTDPSSQLLHVYMVSAKNKDRVERDRSSSPRAPGNSNNRSVSPRMTLDPAVVRAVDRIRVVERARTLSESGGKVVARVRTVSEAEDKVERQVIPRTRQRTCSESGLAVREDMPDLRTEAIRHSFLSGAAKRSSPTLPVPLPFAKKSKPDVTEK